MAVSGALIRVGPGATWLPPVRRQLTPALAGLGRPGHLALTFDDGPDPDGTPAVLEVLQRLGWRATFFLLGRMVQAAPEVAAAVVAGGHEIAVHGHGHEHGYLLARSARSTEDDLGLAIGAIEAATGVRPHWYRPPYGVLTTAGLRAARRHGLRPVLWSAWGKDWLPGATPRSVVRELTRGVLSGGTALLHDSDVTSAPGTWRVTARALPLLAEEVERRRLRVGPLAEHKVRAGRRMEPVLPVGG